MPTDASFIQAIIAAPNDATLRLVYADWLDDRDDLRGEYLRLQHALCLHSGNPCHAKDIQIQLTTLAAQLPLPWLAFFDGSAAWERLRQLGPRVRDKDLFSEALAAARATEPGVECR